MFVYVGVYVVLSTTGLVLLRASLSHAARGPAEFIRDPRLLLGAILYAASFLSWLAALREYKLSTLYPIATGVGYCAVVLASVLFLDERISPGRLVGIVLVGVGILLIAK